MCDDRDLYEFQFKICNQSSIQILVRDRRHKRKFCNFYSAKKLQSLNLYYEIEEFYNILLTAKDAKKNNLKNWKLSIRYLPPTSDLDEAQLSVSNTLSSYKSGYKLVFLLHVSEPRFYIKTAFKLNEMQSVPKLSLKQSETNKIRNIISPKMKKDSGNDFGFRCQSTRNASRRTSSKLGKRSKSQTFKKRTDRSLSPNRHSLPNDNINKQIAIATPMSKKRKSINTNVNKQNIDVSDKENVFVEVNEVSEDLEQMALIKNNNKSLWLKQKIDRTFKYIDDKLVESTGINLPQLQPKNSETSTVDLQETVTVFAEIIQKLTKYIGCKEEEYESLNNKLTLCKKKNKELKTERDSLQNTIENQRQQINETNKKLNDRNASIHIMKQKEVDFEHTIRTLQREIADVRLEYDQQIEDINEQNMQIRVNLKNSMQEMTETKTDFDDIVQQKRRMETENEKLVSDNLKLKEFVQEMNKKTLSLCHYMATSKQMISKLTYTPSHRDSADSSSLESDISSIPSISNSNNNFV